MINFVMGLFIGAMLSFLSMVAILNYLMDRYDKR